MESLSETTTVSPSLNLSEHNYIWIEPNKGHAHTHTLIFFHGLCSSPDEYKQFWQNSSSPLYAPGLRVVLPEAPVELITAMNYSRCTSWFDMTVIED